MSEESEERQSIEYPVTFPILTGHRHYYENESGRNAKYDS